MPHAAIATRRWRNRLMSIAFERPCPGRCRSVVSGRSILDCFLGALPDRGRFGGQLGGLHHELRIFVAFNSPVSSRFRPVGPISRFRVGSIAKSWRGRPGPAGSAWRLAFRRHPFYMPPHSTHGLRCPAGRNPAETSGGGAGEPSEKLELSFRFSEAVGCPWRPTGKETENGSA